MEDVIKTFEHKQFGKIRVLGDAENPRFGLSDMCKVLELPQVAKVVQRLDKDVLSTHPLETAGGIQQMYFVNEDGFYDVLLDSRKPVAKKFRKWVTSEVLPSIRKTGSYSIIAPEIPDPAVKKALKNSYRQFINVCVYVLLMSDDTVKIGYTKRLCKRISEIKSQFKLSVKDVHITPFMSCEKAQIVERCFKEIYSSQRMKGEIFSVDFDSACKTVNHFVELVSVPAIVSDFERGERLFQIAETMPDSPEKQRVLISSAKFIVGSKYD